VRSLRKRAIVVTGPGYQDHELLYPYYRLLEDEFQVDIFAASIGDIFGILGTKMVATKSFADLSLNDYDLLVLPGGVKSIEKVRLEPRVLSFIAQWHKSGKLISSICHGAQLLISAKIIKGKRISGYYSIKDDIENAGAIYVDEAFVTDGNIVSSPHYKHLGPWMKETLRQFYIKNDQKN